MRAWSTLLILVVVSVAAYARTLDGWFPSDGVAGLATASFVLHPWHPESVAWSSGRTDVFATCYVLATLVLYVLREHDSRAMFALVNTYVLGLLSKETAIVTLPLTVMVAGILPPEATEWRLVSWP